MNIKKTLEKRIISVLMTVIMIFYMMPLPIFAAEEDVAQVTVGGVTTVYAAYDDAVAYANTHGGTLKLLADIVSPEYTEVDSIPFITGDFTLDLNGKNIDMVNVGEPVFDETTDDLSSGTPGMLTVTGDGRIEMLAVNSGALTVNGGTVGTLDADYYSGTVSITGGTVDELKVSTPENEAFSVTVSGGSVKALESDSSACTVTITGGNHGSQDSYWSMNGGTVNINGGSFTALNFTIVYGDIVLNGGEFDYISTDPPIASSEYKKTPLGQLLGVNCAFYDADGNFANADVLTLENVKVFAGHNHTYKDGKCTECGALCKHDRSVEYAMGICEDCGVQLEAAVVYQNKKTVYFTSFISALDSVQNNKSEQVTLILLKPEYELNDTLIQDRSNNIKLDLNGHILFGKGKIVVEKNSAITLANGEVDSEFTVEAAGGEVTVEKDCEEVGIIRVTDAESVVSVQGGTIGSLRLSFTDTESLKNVELSGGFFKDISFSGSGMVMITDMLAPGYAFRDNRGTLVHSAGKLVPYGISAYAMTKFSDYEVVPCEHSAANEVKGYCNYCGKLYEAKIVDKDGNVSYLSTLTDTDLRNAENGTVKLLQDKDRCDIMLACTFELNGRKLNTLQLKQEGTVTLKGSGTVSNLILGDDFNGQTVDSTLIINETASGKITVDYLAVNKSTETKLNGGTFKRIQRKDGLSVADLLADGYAFFKVDDETPIYFGNETDINGNYYIDKHDHSFTVNSDGLNECVCGMTCDHDEIEENGKCTRCKTQIYFAVLTKADGSKTKYESFDRAWAAAIENSGSTLKLLCDLELDSVSNPLSINSGKFTLDLGGFELEGFASEVLLAVSGTAELVIRNGSLSNTYYADGDGQVFRSSANTIVQEGGSVTLDGVTLTGAHGVDTTTADGEVQANSVILYDGTLTVTDSTFIGTLATYKLGEDKHPVMNVKTAALRNGINYAYLGTDKDYSTIGTFFADGSMLLDGNGKYIDITDDDYWFTEGGEQYGFFLTSFDYRAEAIVKPHTHIYANGVCSECDYACPHNSGKNDREASYFEKAICSVCHGEYGGYAEDIVAPTGEIKIKERTWWQALLNTISFGLFYKEEVTVQIVAEDDSYSQIGFDKTKHTVKIEYFISTVLLSEEAVKNGTFDEYTKPFNISDDDSYVVYVKLTDHAGNVTYAGSQGFEIDTTAPLIGGMDNGNSYTFCVGKTITVTEKNIDKVVLDDVEISLDENGQFKLSADSKQHKIVVTDKAENETTVYVTVYPSHDFDSATGKCRHCAADAAVKVVNGELTAWFADGDELFKALRDEKYSGATVTLLADVNVNGDAYLKNDLTIDLNGKKLQGAADVQIMALSGAVTIRSSNGKGSVDANLSVNGADASLTMENGIDEVRYILFREGYLTICDGRYNTLNSVYEQGDEAEHICLYGGSFTTIYLQSAFGSQILGKNCRYDGISYSAAKKNVLSNVSVIPCDHADINDNVCLGCGLEFFLAVEANGTTKLFDTFESAVSYAEQNDGSTVKLLQDLTLDAATAGSFMDTYCIDLRAGRYTLDFAGKTLDVDGNYFIVHPNCELTVDDSVGGKFKDSKGTGVFKVNAGGKLTIKGGDFTANVMSFHRNALTLKGGRFAYVTSTHDAGCSPFEFLADGYTFALADGSRYANESDVSNKQNERMIANVSVEKAPVNIVGQVNDTTLYLTSPDSEKYINLAATYVGGETDKMVTITLEKTDGTVIETKDFNAREIIIAAFNLKNFTEENSERYRIKAEFNGYVLYSDTFKITVAECEHPGYDEETHKCAQCLCDLAAVITNGDKTTGYENFADALAAAQTDENKGCTLKLLADVSGNAAVKSGTFVLDATNVLIDGKLNVSKGVDLTVIGGTVKGNVICAKGGKLTATGTDFAGAINCVGKGEFRNCHLANTVAGKDELKLYACEIISSLSISGNAAADMCIVSGEITVNNGAKLKLLSGTYRNTVKAKSGGTLEIVNGTYSGAVTAESDCTFIASGGDYNEVSVEDGVAFTLSGGKFTKITVGGKKLIDCLADGMALEDMNICDVIDGRVGIASNVKVVSHTHSCIWKINTHEKLCGCGYVEATDTEAPVISDIENGKTYYGTKEFSVTDANDFTVTLDGRPIEAENGKYTIVPNNELHIVTATDVAGNTVSIRVRVNELYRVTLPSGTGYTVTGANTAGYGTEYEFTVNIADGYSRTENYRVLVNSTEIDSSMGDESSDTFIAAGVNGDLNITVEGVADITPPNAEITIGTNKFNSFLNTITFGLFFKKTQTVTVTASDAGSGIDKVEYLLSETAFADKDAIIGDWAELILENGKASFDIEPNRKVYVYLRATDISGNVQVINSDGAVIYTDSEAITESVSFIMLSNNDVSFEVKLNGNTVAALYNGDTPIESGNYDVAADGTVKLKNSYLTTLAAGEYTIRTAYNPMGEIYRSGDEPAMTSVKLTVEKETPTVKLEPRTQKTYDGAPIDPSLIDWYLLTNGARIWEYKSVGADDTAYSKTPPKDVGEYTVRLTTTETDTYKASMTTTLFVIVPKEVMITNVNIENKVYDGTTEAEISDEGTIDGLIGDDKVNIVSGKANYSDKNVGVGKTVIFSEFSLAGNDAANYVLTAQPASTTASISAKELTVADLKVKDKQYDGENTAEIDVTPTLVGVVDGDVLKLVNGTPTFDSVTIGKNITVSFTMFELEGDSVTVGNYTLKQPSGITANIVEYIADGSEYSVNSNDWINTSFVIMAKEGYKLSLTGAADGEWSDMLTASDETDNGKLTFYVKNMTNGAISEAVTENYKIDKTAPIGEVKLNERTAFQQFINNITFGLFFKGDVNVKLTATDDASGVKSVLYFKSDRILTGDEVRAITDWTDNSDFDIKAKDTDKFIVYVRIEDNAGNVAYIGSDGATFDTAAPKVVGVENGKTYYVTKKIAIDDENSDSVTLNGNPVEGVFTIDGDTDALYVIRAVDKAGNVTECTVYMKPISSVTDAISDITADTVKSVDRDTVSSVEQQILDIIETLDDGEATDAEMNKLTEAAAKCKELNKRIAEITGEITRLTDEVNDFEIGKVTSADKTDIEKLIADIDNLLECDNLTDAEREALEILKDTAQTLLDRIAQAKAAAENNEITAVDGITEDNVKLENKEALEKAEKALDNILHDFGGNYTEEENNSLGAKLETVKAALAAIGNAEKAADEINKLPSAYEIKLGDKSEVDRVKEIIGALTENEKAMLGKDAMSKLEALAEKLQRLEETAGNDDSAKTGDTGNPYLWIVMLFISGGVLNGVAVFGKKKKFFVK